MSGLRKLNMMDFTTLIPVRESKIEEAKAEKLPEIAVYKANQIANALHPAVQNLVVTEVAELNEDAKLYSLAPDSENGCPKLAYFSAGQYLSISLKIDSAITSRPYTICSSPSEALKGIYKILVKRAENGFVSDYILKNWKPGTKVTASEPCGNFTWEPLRDAKNVIGLAGGSGISVFYSMAQAIADGIEDFSLTLLYGSKSEKDILLKKELNELAARCEKIKVVHVLSQEEKAGYEHGFLSADLINKYKCEGDYSVFVCGPQKMYDYEREELKKLGIRNKFIRYELAGLSKAPDKDERYSLVVEKRGELFSINCWSKETILVALERAGIEAPSRCRSGECGFCHSHLISGEVYVPEGLDYRRLADKDFGCIHPCCSFPLGDLELNVPAVK